MSVRRVREPLLTRTDGGMQIGLFPSPTWVLPDASDADRLVMSADPTSSRPAVSSRLQEELLAAGVLDASAPEPAHTQALSPAANAALGAERAWLTSQAGQGRATDVLARRRNSGVEIRGGGRWAALLAGLLAAAGVGRLRVVDDQMTTAADICPGGVGAAGLPRGAAATRAAIERGADTRQLGPEGHRDLVVLADGSDLDAAAVNSLMRWETAHLVLAARAHHLQVGPLVVPGATGCLNCWAHTRTDRDPSWPTLMAQVRGRSCDAVGVSAIAVAAGMAAGMALRHLDEPEGADPATIAWVLNATDDPIRREFAVHPLCSCAWSAQPAA